MTASRGVTVRDLIEVVLRKAGGPLSVNAIAERLPGMNLGTINKQLSSHCKGDPFVKLDRGIYALPKSRRRAQTR